MRRLPVYLAAVEVTATTLEKLSFGRVQQALAERAGTFMGMELAGELTPHANTESAVDALERVEEIVVGGDLSLGGIEDVRPLLQRVRDGNLLTGSEILSIAYTLDGAATLRRGIVASDRPALTTLALGIGSFDGVLRLVREQLDIDGNVRDDATPKLSDIRRRLNPLRNRIREQLTRLLDRFSEYVQDPIITLRRDRYVIPIKAHMQSRVSGLTLDRSDSGATVFIEPAGVVDLNNELALLELEERDEVRRILQALGRRLADEPLVDDSLSVVAQLDLVNAAARLARDWRLKRPAFAEGGRVRLLEARHPLIADCVPNDIELDDERRLLIITGPNAGGKTVLLKTLGLAVTMAYSGLFVAAGGDRAPLLPEVDNLLSDIGDEQSIEASLSTYAGHLVNLKAIVEHAGSKTLLLIDELGSGTDPNEGAALSQAILERILAGGARGLVTTHLAPLKLFASETEGVSNAAMRFDVERLAPSYQLIVGQPGRSYALAIAERLGLPASLLKRAAELFGPEGERLEQLLATLEEQREELEGQLDEARVANERAVAEAELLREQIRTLRSREEELLAAAAEKADELLQETLQQATKLKRVAQQEPEQRSKALEEIHELRRRARRVAGATGQGGGEGSAYGASASPRTERGGAGGEPADRFAPGTRVRVESYGAEGAVLERRGSNLLVQLGLLKVEVPQREVRLLAPERKERRTVKSVQPVIASVSTRLNIRGERAEEAIEQVRDFILEAQAQGAETVEIVHGKGTGALRDAVRGYLKNERLVERYEDAVPYRGGHGVTVAYLRK